MGIDAVDVERFRRLLGAGGRGMAERIFTEAERSFLSGRVDPVPGLAARFAAKEATMKALGTGLGGVRFAEVEVLGGGSGSAPARGLRAGRAVEPRRSGSAPGTSRSPTPTRSRRPSSWRTEGRRHATGPHP